MLRLVVYLPVTVKQ